MDQAYYYAVGTSRGRLPAAPLAGDTPQRYTSVSNYGGPGGQVIVGVLRPYRASPGLRSGTCFRTNRPCRLAPAHQGMKIAGAR